MTVRMCLADVTLWLELLLVGILVGASVYQRISLIPEWGGALPDSVVKYFRGTTAAAAIGRFWASILPPLVVMMIVTVSLNWAYAGRRQWTGIAGLLMVALVLWTVTYFLPKGVVPLMEKGAVGMEPDEITRMAKAWIFWDWFRMAGSIAAFFALVKAVTIRL